MYGQIIINAALHNSSQIRHEYTAVSGGILIKQNFVPTQFLFILAVFVAGAIYVIRPINELRASPLSPRYISKRHTGRRSVDVPSGPSVI